MNRHPALKNRLRAKQYHASIAALLISTCAFPGQPVLECHGIKADNPNIRYELNVTSLDAIGVIVVADSSNNEECVCKLRLSDFDDRSKAARPGYRVTLKYQSCDTRCSQNLKKQMRANVEVRQVFFPEVTYSTPFVGLEISKCDRFSIDVPALKNIGIR
jgi:hypothetical protein